MRRFVPILLLLSLAVCASADDIDYTRINPVVEMRGIWLDAGAIPKTEAGIRALVQQYHQFHLNVIFPEIIARGYTVYKSNLLARDPRFDGAIDPLPIIINEAHKLGMEVHPWVWVFRAGYTKDRGAILTAHPDWAMLGKNGQELSPNGGLWISPAVPAARDFVASLLKELVTKYDIDGLHLDYIRYEVQSPVPYGYENAARNEFCRQYCVDPVDIDRLSPRMYEWNRYRERLINTFVQRIAFQTRAIKPHVLISAAVGSDPTTARVNLLQNWPNWAANKWVDFLTPMAYTANNDSFKDMVQHQLDAVSATTLLAPGIGVHLQKNNVEQTIQQIGLSRQLLTCGQMLFASSHIGEKQEIALMCGPYLSSSPIPFRMPENKSCALAAAAAKCSGQMADYYRCQAGNLAKYAAYRNSNIPYVVPTQPPLNIPDNVLPLPTVNVPRVSSPVQIDGSCMESAWANAASVQLQYDNMGKPVSVRTDAFLIHDDKCLYVAFRCYEPNMAQIKAAVEKRDGPTFYDDSVEVFADPAAKGTEYYHLSTNTLGTRFDQKVFNPSWNAEWQTASSRSTDSWTTEIAIPFAALGADSPLPGTKWAVNLTRNRTITGIIESIAWAVPYGSFHSLDRFGTIVFE